MGGVTQEWRGTAQSQNRAEGSLKIEHVVTHGDKISLEAVQEANDRSGGAT